MPAITLKNIPPDIYERLKEAARAHHRSLNSEIINCLEAALKPRRVSPAERLERLRRLREDVSPARVSAADIRKAIDEGRP